jgi:hypothetical protein
VQVCAPDLASVEAEVASVINRDVIPSFLKVFVKQLGSSSTPKEPAVRHSGNMQGTSRDA